VYRKLFLKDLCAAAGNHVPIWENKIKPKKQSNTLLRCLSPPQQYSAGSVWQPAAWCCPTQPCEGVPRTVPSLQLQWSKQQLKEGFTVWWVTCLPATHRGSQRLA